MSEQTTCALPDDIDLDLDGLTSNARGLTQLRRMAEKGEIPAEAQEAVVGRLVPLLTDRDP